MKNIKRVLVALVSTVVLSMTLTAAQVPPTSGNGVTLDANPADTCTATSDISTGYVWERGNLNSSVNKVPGANGASGRGITGASLYVVARALEPCRPGTNFSKSYLLVSIEGTISGVENFPQLGLCKFRNVEDQTRFCVMDPGNAGYPTIIRSCCGPALPGFELSQDAPIGGHTYEFQITRVNKAQPGHGYLWYWRYQITDVTLSDVIWKWDSQFEGSGRLLSNPTLVGSAWYGCETGNDDNALGTLGSDLRALMHKAGYRYQNGGSTWYYTQNSTVFSPTGGIWRDAGPYADQHYTHDQNGVLNTDRVGCYTS